MEVETDANNVESIEVQPDRQWSARGEGDDDVEQSIFFLVVDLAPTQAAALVWMAEQAPSLIPHSLRWGRPYS